MRSFLAHANLRVQSHSLFPFSRPPSRLQAPAAAPSTTSFDDLPVSVHLGIVFLLPRLVDRVLVSLVSKRWAALLGEPAFWAELSFDGVKTEHLGSDLLLQLARRAAGSLRSLTISDEHPPLPAWRALFAAMAAEGLTRSLQHLVAPRATFAIEDAAGAQALRSACPALTSAAVHIRASWRDALAAMRALGSCAAGSTVELAPTGYTGEGADVAWGPGQWWQKAAAATIEAADFATFATALAETLGCCTVKEVVLGIPGGSNATTADMQTLFDRLGGGDAAAVERAAASLGAALADPLRGPRELRVASRQALQSGVEGSFRFPAAAHVARALTVQSPLRVLQLTGNLSADAYRALAAALAPGRSCLEELLLEHTDIDTAEGCVFKQSTNAPGSSSHRLGLHRRREVIPKQRVSC